MVLFLIVMFNVVLIGYIVGMYIVVFLNDINGYECFVSDDLKEFYILIGYFFFFFFEVFVLGFVIVLLYFFIRRVI